MVRQFTKPAPNTITVGLPDHILTALKQAAARVGVTPSEYVHHLLTVRFEQQPVTFNDGPYSYVLPGELVAELKEMAGSPDGLVPVVKVVRRETGCGLRAALDVSRKITGISGPLA